MSEELSKAVAAELRRLLNERSMSGNQLAQTTGMNQPSLARKLRGATVIDLNDLPPICAALGISVQDLITWAQRS